MQEGNKRREPINQLCAAVLFLTTTLLVCLLSRLKGFDTAEIISNTVLSGIGAAALVLLISDTKRRGGLDYDNARHPLRFLLLYVGCLLVAAACIYLPAAGWQFLAIYIALALFSDSLIGICAGTLLLALSVLLSGCGIPVFVLYFLCGTAGVILFRGLDETYRIGMPLFLTLLLLLTGETAAIVLFANEQLKLSLFQIPLLNVLISLILLLILLKCFSALVIFRYRGKYLEINDTEFELMVRLKEKSKEEYYQAVHTAYFCERIANRLSLDTQALKTGGYYHRIGVLCEHNTWEEVEKLLAGYQFPPAASALLKEYLDEGTGIKKKETAVLVLSDAVVAAILYLISRNGDQALDYDRIIETVFKKKLETPLLQNCNITMEELTQMKKLFKEEKLYYDFLR